MFENYVQRQTHAHQHATAATSYIHMYVYIYIYITCSPACDSSHIISTCPICPGSKAISSPRFLIAREISPRAGSMVRNSRKSLCGFITMTSPLTSPRSLSISSPPGSSSGLSLSNTVGLHRFTDSNTTHSPARSALTSIPSDHSKQPAALSLVNFSNASSAARSSCTVLATDASFRSALSWLACARVLCWLDKAASDSASTSRALADSSVVMPPRFSPGVRRSADALLLRRSAKLTASVRS
jgi:hypothetical protein